MAAGIAGRKSVVKVMGTPTALTTEPTASAGDNLNYQIANVAKRVLDPTAAITVLVGGSPVAATTYTLDRLTGRVTFAVALVRTVTITGTYVPTNVAARSNAYDLTMSAPSMDDTDWDTATTDGGFTRKQRGMAEASGTISGKFDINNTFRTNFINDDLVLLEFFPDASGVHDAICWAKLSNFALDAKTNEVIGQSIGFFGAADADGRVLSA